MEEIKLYKEIRAVYNQDSIRVYQAYCESISIEREEEPKYEGI